MTKKVSPIPKGYRTATPCLVVADVTAAIDFYSNAFAATTLSLTNDPTNTLPVHATIKIGNSIVVLQKEATEAGIFSPATLGSVGSQIHLYVEDIDGFWATAVSGGAYAITEPVDAYWGDRTASLTDPFGHVWSVASRIEHVSREEIQRRSAAIFLPDAVTENTILAETPVEIVAEGEYAQDIAA